MPEFDACFETMRQRHEEIDRIQVTNRAMEALVLSTGIAEHKVHRIPIGIDVDVFQPVDGPGRLASRTLLGLPETAFVVGSFQKDGVGWGEGLEPKLIKGPDILLAVAEILRDRDPRSRVPPHRALARVREGGAGPAGDPLPALELPDVEDVAQAYPAIDVCLVASRDEGGPRAVLESMATRVPIVTTRVGQAADLVRHGANGWMVEPEDVEGLVDLADPRRRRDDDRARSRARRRARARGGVLLRRAPSALAGAARRLRRAVRRVMEASLERAGRYGRAATRWARLLASGAPAPGLRVFYGHDRVPAPGERAAGGTAKMQKLAERFPNTPIGFSLLYLGTTWLPRDLGPLLGLVRRRGIPLVVNQDGVGYPGWAGERSEEVNRPLREAVLAADHVLYQSEFSKRSADHVPGGAARGVGDPPERGRRGPLHARGVAARGRARAAARRRPDAGVPARARAPHAARGCGRPIPTRGCSSPGGSCPTRRSADRGARPRRRASSSLGEYAQRDAPGVFRRAHVLLHTKVQDPCPTLVLEAMACGLPVVYAGERRDGRARRRRGRRRRPAPRDVGARRAARPEALAAAVERVLGDLAAYSSAARARVVERFALEPWLERHRALFEELVR